MGTVKERPMSFSVLKLLMNLACVTWKDLVRFLGLGTTLAGDVQASTCRAAGALSGWICNPSAVPAWVSSEHYRQQLRGHVCLCTCAYGNRCGDFLIRSYIYSEPGLEWDTDSPWSRNLLGAEMWLTCYPADIIVVCILLWFTLTPLSHYYTSLNSLD